MTYSVVAITDPGTCICATSCAVDMQLLMESICLLSHVVLFVSPSVQ